MIILDFGSGNTCKNDKAYVKRMINELAEVDSRNKEVVIKWQLFLKGPPNTPLRLDVFDFAYYYAEQKGYQTTASVFDIESLKYLLLYDIPFVKIANRPDLYWLAGEMPRKMPVFMSIDHIDKREDIMFDEIIGNYAHTILACISKYPAAIKDYEKAFTFEEGHALINISDHTVDFELYHKYEPSVIEWHYKLHDSTGLDAGPFARTPKQLEAIL